MDTIFSIMREEKGNQKEQVKIPMDRFSKYFPRGTPQKRIESVIFDALDLYYREQERLRRRNSSRDEL
jgi:ParB family chromosome partitioning protein